MAGSEDLTDIESAINEMEDEALNTYIEDIDEKPDLLMRRKVRKVMAVSAPPEESPRATPRFDEHDVLSGLLRQDSLIEANRTLAQAMLDDSSDSDENEKEALRQIMSRSQPHFPLLQVSGHLPNDSHHVEQGAESSTSTPAMWSPYASSLKPEPTMYVSPKAKERSSILHDREQSVAELYWRVGRMG